MMTSLVKKEVWAVDLISLVNLFTYEADIRPTDVIRHWVYTLYGNVKTEWASLQCDDHTLTLQLRNAKQKPIIVTVADAKARCYTLLQGLFHTKTIVATGYDRKGVARCEKRARMTHVLGRVPSQEVELASTDHKRLVQRLGAHCHISRPKLWWKVAMTSMLVSVVATVGVFMPKAQWPYRKRPTKLKS